jgi:hypothetical protein
MAGSWERSKFDEGEYQHYIKESTGSLLYQMDPNKYYNCKECRPQQPGYIGTGVSISKKNTLVDVESELKNITRKQTRDPKGKYLPCKKQGKQEKLLDKPSCGIITDETRSSNPACNLRGTGTSQHVFYELCQDPQSLQAIEHPGRILINDTRMAKDNHRPILPKPIDINPSLPKNKPIKMPLCCPNSGSQLECVFTDPLFNNYENAKPHTNLHVQPALEYNYERIMRYHNNLN